MTFRLVSSAHSAHAAKETRWQATCGETAPGLPASFGHSHAFSGPTRRLGVPVPGPMNGRTPDPGARAKSRRDGRGDRRAARESRGGREGLRRRQEASGQDEALSGKESRPTILSDWGITLDQVHGRESSWIKGCMTVPGERRTRSSPRLRGMIDLPLGGFHLAHLSDLDDCLTPRSRRQADV